MNGKQKPGSVGDATGQRVGEEKLSTPHYSTKPTAIQQLLDQAAERMATDPARCLIHAAIWQSLYCLKTGKRWPLGGYYV